MLLGEIGFIVWIEIKSGKYGFGNFIVYIMFNVVYQCKWFYLEVFQFGYDLVDGSGVGYIFFQYLKCFFVKGVCYLINDKIRCVFGYNWYFIL